MSARRGEDGRSKTSRPAWLLVSVFVGTSLAVAIPLVMIRKAKATALQNALKDASAPPRRAAAVINKSPSHNARFKVASVPRAQPARPIKASDFDAPGTGELLSAVSKADLSTTLMAGKAFTIATAIVGVGAVGLTWGIQTLLGVDTVEDFAKRMRFFMHSYFPGIIQHIHRPPENEDERREARQVAPMGVDEDWTWADAEKRLNVAYEQGGFSLWAQVALRELEAEVRVERSKRLKDFESQQQNAHYVEPSSSDHK